jgi:colanic acid biosynthesis glycosyl transferase WcaI
MRILLVSGYYYPEQVGAGLWVRQLASDLKTLGHDVCVLTSFPSYPHGRVFEGYRGRFFQRETVEGIPVIRTWVYATPSKNFWARVAAFGSFCASALIGGLAARIRADVVYAILPPLPLGISAAVLAKAAGARLAVSIQDIYPDIAVSLGVLRNRRAIQFFMSVERWIYRRAHRIVVISEGFRQNLLEKGVPAEKIAVVPNWADPDAIRPANRENAFRNQHSKPGEFVVLYSGSLSHNSRLEPVLEAARQLAGEPFRFLIAGEGVHKPALADRADRLGLRNVSFLPFQPLERYAEALAAADATLVTLHPGATFASVPSKVYKQMAAARPILAIADRRSEVARLVEESGCGLAIQPDDAFGLVEALRRLAARREEVARMGAAGRGYITDVCSRGRCVAAIENALAVCQ